jgi:hypothetical protein
MSTSTNEKWIRWLDCSQNWILNLLDDNVIGMIGKNIIATIWGHFI